MDDLKEQEIKLKHQNEEDQAIIQDENTSPSEREAAGARVAVRNKELWRLQTQVEEREAAMPLREKVCEIFKKYGVIRTAIFLAVGVTIGAVIGTITNASKGMGKELQMALKHLGQKLLLRCPD